ncbi:MAG: hypothetical protein GY811_07725 [Myxococcales bacterium]|nr:hypothetical protein [Myxococcales bacterium]
MSAVGAEREIWQERAGVFYPLVVAAQAQSGLPLAGRLVPTGDDLKTSLPWMPVVGLGLGVLWSFVAASCVEVGLSALVSAAIVVVAVVACGGLCFERALANKAEEALGRWRRAMGQAVEGEDALLSTVAVVSLAIVMRTAALASIASADLTAALIAAAVLSRWVISLAPLIASLKNSEQDFGALLRYVLIAGGVAIVMALCQGISGLVLMVLAGAAMFVVSRKSTSVSKNMSVVLSLALVVEVLVVLGQ